MTNSILEITDKEYLIKLSRETFNLSFIRNLIKIVEVASPDAESAVNAIPGDFNRIPSAEPEYYSSLEEK